MDIVEVRDRLVPEIREGLTLLAGGVGVATLGRVYEELSLQFEALGLCYLLADGDAEGMRTRLVRAGHARRYYLHRTTVEKAPPTYHLALTRQNGLFDALAAGHLDLARQIAQMSAPVPFDSNWEYEEDFRYFTFLHSILLNPTPTVFSQAQRDLLDAFEAALDGDDSPRFDLCVALTARDPGSFAQHLMSLMDAEQSAVDEEREEAHVLEGDLCYWPRSFVSVEGLALLKTGELLSIPAPKTVPRCPDLARLGWTSFNYDDFFDEIQNA
jgi:hypothetical protein